MTYDKCSLINNNYINILYLDLAYIRPRCALTDIRLHDISNEKQTCLVR